MRTLLLLASLVTLSAPAAAQPAGDPVPKILEAWKKRQTAFKTVKYVITGKVEHLYIPVPKPQFKDKLPKTPCEVPFRAVVLFDCVAGRYRLELDEFVPSIPAQGFVAINSTRVYDGKRLSSTLRTGQDQVGANAPDATIAGGNLAQQEIPAHLWPVFAAQGIVATARSPLRPDKFPRDHSRDEFVHRGNAALDGVRCEILHSQPVDAVPTLSDELWVRPGEDGFVARHAYSAGRVPFLRIDARSQVIDGARLPKEWTCTLMEGKRTRAVCRLKVEEFQGDPAIRDEDFTLALRTGATVEEHSIPAPGSGLDPTNHAVRRYTVGPDGHEMVTGSRPQQRLDGTTVPEGGTTVWLWVGGMVVLAILIGTYLWRRRR